MQRASGIDNCLVDCKVTRKQGEIRKTLKKEFKSVDRRTLLEAREKTRNLLQIWTKKARALTKSRNFKELNDNFSRNKSLPKTRQVSRGQYPSQESVEEFWSGILEVPGEVSADPGLEAWAANLKDQSESSQEKFRIPDELWKRVVSKIKPFIATGPDCIYGFFLKKMPLM